jgi:hypothetical protein
MVVKSGLNITHKMNLKDYYIYLKIFADILLILLILPVVSIAQVPISEYDNIKFTYSEFAQNESGNLIIQSDFPSPKSVLYRSLMVPGWGQIINKQWWKVPIIYGLFAGGAYYTIDLTGSYRDYRAAYYNLTRGAESDFRFGATPDYLAGVTSTEQLRQNRDTLRNQRDFMYVVMVLIYGLNVVDAYVYAHMRSFDVSDDLSAIPSIQPGMVASSAPGFTFRLSLLSK